MRLTAKSAYAIKAMYDLVTHSSGKPISIRSISQRAGISTAFLCQIFNRIRRKGLIKSVRGANGGYVLAKQPEAIMIKDIITALEEPFFPEWNGLNGRGLLEDSQADNRAIKIVWQSLKEKISEVLSNTSLADVCKRKQGK